jgi:hypothetical protein
MDDSHMLVPELTLPPQFKSDSSVRQSHPSRPQTYSIEEWDAMKPFIKKSYIDNNETLGKLIKRLSEEHDFHPTSVPFHTPLLL